MIQIFSIFIKVEYFFIHFRMPPKQKRQKLSDTCNICNISVTHLKRHMLKSHMPWYVSPSSACADCHVSEGSGSQFQFFHRRQRGIAGELLAQVGS